MGLIFKALCGIQFQRKCSRFSRWFHWVRIDPRRRGCRTIHDRWRFCLFLEQDPNVIDTDFKTNRDEILAIANGSASGSLLGNTAFAIYYPTSLPLIINHSAQGAAYGGMATENLHEVDPIPGTTEQIEIAIARAIAHGAAMGAVFQIVGIQQDSMPDIRTYDMDTISAVESVTYGSTYGAITGDFRNQGKTPSLFNRQSSKAPMKAPPQARPWDSV